MFRLNIWTKLETPDSTGAKFSGHIWSPKSKRISWTSFLPGPSKCPQLSVRFLSQHCLLSKNSQGTHNTNDKTLRCLWLFLMERISECLCACSELELSESLRIQKWPRLAFMTAILSALFLFLLFGWLSFFQVCFFSYVTMSVYLIL